jgi:hypothetical protein
MELDAKNHMVIFLCIDYTIWPGWNHRGVYILSRKPELQAGSLYTAPNVQNVLYRHFDERRTVGIIFLGQIQPHIR